MTELWIADSGVRQLHARFVDAVWRKDDAAFAGCFSLDGEWKIAGQHFRGRQEIGSAFATLLGACERVQLIVGIPVLEIAQGRASGRTPVTELARMLGDADAETARRHAVVMLGRGEG